MLNSVIIKSLLGRVVQQSRLDPYLAELLHQLPALVHLQQDITAAHKLALEENLNIGQ